MVTVTKRGGGFLELRIGRQELNLHWQRVHQGGERSVGNVSEREREKAGGEKRRWRSLFGIS